MMFHLRVQGSGKAKSNQPATKFTSILAFRFTSTGPLNVTNGGRCSMFICSTLCMGESFILVPQLLLFCAIFCEFTC